MNPNRLHTTPALDDHAARFLAAVYGPLGPVAGIRAWKAGIVEAERLTAGRTRGTYSLGAAIDDLAFRHDVPGYLAGRTRSELWKDTANYVEAHEHEAPWPDELDLLRAGVLRQCDGCGVIEDAGTFPDQDGAGRSECCTDESAEVTA